MNKKITLGIAIFCLIHSYLSFLAADELDKKSLGSRFGMVTVSASPKYLKYYPLLTEVGVEAVRLSLPWNKVESKKSVFNWKAIDKTVKDIQDLGLDIFITVYPKSDWACVESKSLASTPVDWTAWEEFVYKLIERYDNDGKSDMPGLKKPLRFWGLGNEPYTESFWSGSKEDYVRLVNSAYKAAKAASSECQISLGGMGSGIIAVALATEGQINEPLATSDWGGEELRTYSADEIRKHLPAKQKQKIEFARYCLSNANYDLADIHLYGRRSDHAKIISWVRRYTNKPIIATEAGGPSLLYYKYSDRLHAQEVIKVHIVDFAEGVEKIFWWKASEQRGKYTSFANSKCALLTEDMVPKPGYYTYRILTSKLSGFDSVEKLAEGQYKFMVKGKPVYVLWSDEGNKKIILPIKSSLVEVTHIITKVGETEPQTEQISVKDGNLVLSLTAEPIFVEEK